MQVARCRTLQRPIKLNQDQQQFRFQFSNVSVRFSVDIACPSVLSSNNLKPHKT